MATWLPLVLSIAIPLGTSFAVNLATGPPGEWYKSLNKPTWTPPNWAFPVVWTTLYVLMGVASWLVWSRGGFVVNGFPLSIYALQLALNFLWTPLFFGAKRIDWAFYEIVVMLIAIVATIVNFWAVSKTAALLLVPYVAWVSLATCLTYYIYLNNPGDPLTEPLRSTDE